MLYLANPSGADVLAAMDAGLLGFIDTPAQGNVRPSGIAWCADNGCFGEGYPGDAEWFAWLERNTNDAPTCLFATAPDVVGDAAASLARSLPWLRPIRSLGYPAALVAQNGLTPAQVPWDEFDVLFIGGTVECPNHGATLEPIVTGRGRHRRTYCPTCRIEIFEWKEGPKARALVDAGLAHGKRIHMGRVNGQERYDYARYIGCHSADGTYLTFGPDINLPKLLGWGARHDRQEALL